VEPESNDTDPELTTVNRSVEQQEVMVPESEPNIEMYCSDAEPERTATEPQVIVQFHCSGKDRGINGPESQPTIEMYCSAVELETTRPTSDTEQTVEIQCSSGKKEPTNNSEF